MPDEAEHYRDRLEGRRARTSRHMLHGLRRVYIAAVHACEWRVPPPAGRRDHVPPEPPARSPVAKPMTKVGLRPPAVIGDPRPPLSKATYRPHSHLDCRWTIPVLGLLDDAGVLATVPCLTAELSDD